MIETERLILRPWQERDRAAYHAIRSDPRVMATLGPVQTRAESDAAMDALIAAERRHGYTFRAVERRGDGALLGWCGLLPGPEGSPVADEVQIGWTLAAEHWEQGYAHEAAAATLAWAWAETDLRRIVAITSLRNHASQRLMIRLGMTRVPDGDFDHPKLADGDPLRRHLTYVLDRPIRTSAPSR